MNAAVSVDLPLLLASSLSAPDTEQFPLDRVRMQKAVFLSIMRGSDSWRDAYRFQPYNWGPYSQDLFNHLDELVARGQLSVRPVAGSRYPTYHTTPAGEDAAERDWEMLEAGERDFIRKVRKYVTSSSFNKLLREVYAAYPKYAAASQFNA